MIQLVEEDEIAERKPYKFSDRVMAKMIRRKKEKEQKRRNMAQVIVRIDTLDEIVSEDVMYAHNLGNVLKA